MPRSSFSYEYKKAVVVAVTAAFAYIIAIAWSDALSEHIDRLLKQSPVRGKIVSALLITLLSVLGLFGVAWLTRDLGKK